MGQEDPEGDAILAELAKATGTDPATIPPPRARRIQDPRGALGYIMEGVSRPFQATAAAIEAPAGEKLGAFGRGLVSGAPEAREKLLSDIKGEKPGFLSTLAANAVEFAGDVGPAFLLRPGAKTRLAKKGIRAGELREGMAGGLEKVSETALPGRVAEVAGELKPVTAKVSTPMPVGEQFEKGLRSATGFRSIVPMPAALQRGIGKVEAPLIRSASSILGTIGNTRPAKWTQDAASAIFGTRPGSADLRVYHDRLQKLQVDERAARQSVVMERILREDTFQRLKATTGLTEDEALRAIGLIWERGTIPGTEGFALAEKYPALRDFANYMKFSAENTRSALEALTDAGFMGERGMRERAATSAEALKAAEGTPEMTAGQRIVAALEAAAKAGAETTRGSSLDQLHYGHIFRTVTKEGGKFFGAKGEPGTGKWIRDVNFALRDPATSRTRWLDMTLDEINLAARDGALPGYEGIKANGPIFEVNPLNAAAAQALISGQLISRARMLHDLVNTPFGKDALTGKPTTLGRRLKEFGSTVGEAVHGAENAGYVRLSDIVKGDVTPALSPRERAKRKGLVGEEAKRGPFPPAEGVAATTLDDIVLPEAVARRLRGTLAWVDPDGWMHNSTAFFRGWDAIQGLWSEFTLTPYLYPATTTRNATSEALQSTFAGTHPVSWARAMEMVQGIDRPLGAAQRLNEPGIEAFDVARDATRMLDHFFGSSEARQVLGPAQAEAASTRFFGALRPGGAEPLPDGRYLVWRETPAGTVQQPMSLLELRQEAAALGMTDLGTLRQIRTGLKSEAEKTLESSPLQYLHSVFGDKDAPLNDLQLFHRRVGREIVRYAEELPRLAQFLEGTIERGLTPRESAAWVNSHHVDMTRPMTFTERKVFRRAAPFYRWTRFATPYAFRTALTRPWVPLTVMKTMDFLVSGDAEKELTPENIPLYMKKTGLYYPMRVEKDETGKPVVYFVTPQGVVPVFDIMQWAATSENAERSARSMLGPVLRTAYTLIANRALQTGADLGGETMYLGFEMPRKMAELLSTWRGLNSLDSYMTPRKDISPLVTDPFSTENLTNRVNPFTMRPIDLVESKAQNERSIAAIIYEQLDIQKATQKRLERQGVDTTELRKRALEVEAALKELEKDLRR